MSRVLAAAMLLVPVPIQARVAACQGTEPPHPGRSIKATPYEQQWYDQAQLAPLATGAGIRVAVIDSGVDDTNPQLRNKVAKGRDFLRNDDSDGLQDCVGHGTGVAGIIAAAPVSGVAFHGLAPDATIVPIRVSEGYVVNGKEAGDQGNTAGLAKAIRYAAGDGRAQVINMSLSAPEDTPEVRDAVRDAIGKGVVIVAAVGNQADEGNPTPYPAANPDVIGVGAIGPDGLRASFSQHGGYVDLVAAGRDVTMTATKNLQTTDSGTSFAAPFVAATAALLLQRFPRMTPAQVQQQLISTADPAPGGRRSDDYGYGLLNPYRALTETIAPARARPPAAVVVPAADPAALALQARRERSQRVALLAAAVGAAVLALAGLATVVLRRGRRRGWRPAPPS